MQSNRNELHKNFFTAIKNNEVATVEDLLKSAYLAPGYIQEGLWKGATYLSYAVYYNLIAIVKILLKNGADACAEFSFFDDNEFQKKLFGLNSLKGYKLLDYAISKKYEALAVTLIKYNAMRYRLPEYYHLSGDSAFSGWNYLAFAVYHHLNDLVAALLKIEGINADRYIPDPNNEIKLIDYAKQKNYTRIVDLLQNYLTEQEQINNATHLITDDNFILAGEHLLIKSKSYIDKTSFISEVIRDEPVRLFCRPPKFGKSLQLSLLDFAFNRKYNPALVRETLANYGIAKSVYFSEHQNGYYIINLKFWNVWYKEKANPFDDFKKMLTEQIKQCYRDFEFLAYSPKLSKTSKKFFKKVLNAETLSYENLMSSLSNLIVFLNKFANKKIILLIDDLDKLWRPFISDDAKVRQNEFKHIFNFVDNFLHEALGDHSRYYRAVLMSSIPFKFDKLHVKTNTLLNDDYDVLFGYEQHELDRKFHAIPNFTKSLTQQIGMQVNDKVLFNPGLFNLVLRYDYFNCEIPELNFTETNTLLQVRDTSSVIYDFTLDNDYAKQGKTAEQLKFLCKGVAIKTELINVIDLTQKPDDLSEPNYMWSLWFHAGLLSIVKQEKENNKTYYYLRPATIYAENAFAQFAKNIKLIPEYYQKNAFFNPDLTANRIHQNIPHYGNEWEVNHRYDAKNDYYKRLMVK